MKTVFVCGHGRCGSSLMMQMLQAGGYPIFGEFPAFEPEEVGFERKPETLLPLIEGRAAKILDPQLTRWPDSMDVAVIWLDRDRNEQGRSQVKFMRACGMSMIPTNAWKRLAASYGADTAAALRLFRDRGIEPLRISFDELVVSPFVSADRIASHLGVKLDEVAMCQAVIRRQPRCQEGMEIEFELLSRKVPA